MQKEDCIFCKIHESKQSIIKEDSQCSVLFDKYPSEYSHMLVISKEHYDNMLTTPENIYFTMFSTAKKMAQKAKDNLGASGAVISTNIGKDAGQVINHFHIHVVPKYDHIIKGFEQHKELSSEKSDELMKKMKFD
jgi:histidine triad (HIT) family protein